MYKEFWPNYALVVCCNWMRQPSDARITIELLVSKVSVQVSPNLTSSKSLFLEYIVLIVKIDMKTQIDAEICTNRKKKAGMITFMPLKYLMKYFIKLSGSY